MCRVYGVPPTCAGIVDQATYSNVEGESRALVQRCLAPMAKRIEAAMAVHLLSPEARKTAFIEHDLNGLLRGDDQARFNAYRLGIQFGWMTRNEVRKLENMAPLDGLDEPLEPLNMGAVGAERDKVLS